VISRDCDLRWYCDWPRNSVESQISGDLQVIDPAAGNSGTAKDNVGILVGQQHDIVQLFVDDLFLRVRKHAVGLFHRRSFGIKLQRGSCERVRIKSRLSGEFAHRDQMIMTLEPKQPAGKSMRHELALLCIEPVARDSGSRKSTCSNARDLSACRRVVPSIHHLTSTAPSQ